LRPTGANDSLKPFDPSIGSSFPDDNVPSLDMADKMKPALAQLAAG
jgi:hypothetical protein